MSVSSAGWSIVRQRHAIVALVTVVACGRDGGDVAAEPACAADSTALAWPAPVALPASPTFRVARTLRPPSTGPGAVLSVRTIDVGPGGALLVTDSRNGDIAILDSLGAVVRKIGRRGSGPGEYRRPFDARFSSGGEIVTVDPELRRISFFDPAGRFLSSFVVRDQDPRAVLWAGDSAVLVAGLIGSTEAGRMIGFYDRKGKRLGAFFRPDPLLFRLALVADQPWIARAPNDDIFAGLTVIPRVHRMSAAGRSICAVATAPPGWKQLEPNPAAQHSLVETKKWVTAASYMTGAAGVLSDGRLVTGYLLPVDSDQRHGLLVYEGGTRPSAVVTVPGRLAYAGPSGLYLVEEQNDGTLVLHHLTTESTIAAR